MRHLLQVIVSERVNVCVCFCEVCVHPLSAVPIGVRSFCYINQMLIQRIVGAALAVGQVAPSSWVMAASLASGITSALRPPRPARIHLLATRLGSFLHLDLFASHQPQHPSTCLVASSCAVIPTHLLISYEQQQPCILRSEANPLSTAHQDIINMKKNRAVKCVCVKQCA